MAGCNGVGVTRTMFRFNLPGVPSNTVVNSANIDLDNLWQSADCAREPLQLWFTPAISSSTDWNNASSWNPDYSWALNDGAANPGTTPTPATDSITGTPGTTYSWASDDSFGNVFDATGGGFISPASDPVPNADPTATISVWFKTTATNQVLISLEDTQITSSMTAGSSITGGYNPVLYIGADGKLCFEWWNGHAYNALSTSNPVNDGLWHHATLAANTSRSPSPSTTRPPSPSPEPSASPPATSRSEPDTSAAPGPTRPTTRKTATTATSPSSMGR